MKVKFTDEQVEFIKEGTCINGECFYMPFWFKATEDKNIFEQFDLNDLHEDLKDILLDIKSQKTG